MKNKTFKRIFTALLSLSLILSMNKLSFADDLGEITLDNTTARLTIDITNTGLTKKSEVKAKVKVNFQTDNPSDTGTTKIVSINIPVTFNDSDLTCELTDFVSPTGEFGNNGNFSSSSLDDVIFSLRWNNGSVDVSVPINTDLELGTIVFKLAGDKAVEKEITLNVSSDSFETTFSDFNTKAAKISGDEKDFVFKNNLKDKPVCEHLNCVKTEAKPATCTEDGNIEYWYCKD